MPKPRLDTRWSLLSLRAVVLENASLRAVILPELGGRIQSIVYKPADRELLWQNPRIPPRRVPFGAAYDDVWSGGWEDIFPNDVPGTIGGESYPDHGELWAMEWTWSGGDHGEEAWVELSATAPISGVEAKKRISLNGDAARLRVDYVLRNPGRTAFPFLWKLHPAFAVQPGDRVDLPPRTRAEIEPAFPGTLAGAEAKFLWPDAKIGGREIDVGEAPPASSNHLHFVYGTGYQQGWCAVTDVESKLTWGLVFPAEVFRYCWVFATYGGWRNYYVAVLEPSTAYPFRIEQAIERGTVSVLEPGGTLAAGVVFQVQRGLSRVSGLTARGEFVRGEFE